MASGRQSLGPEAEFHPNSASSGRLRAQDSAFKA